MAALEIALGIILVVVTIADTVNTLVVARGLTGRWQATRFFYAATWQVWSIAGRRISSEHRREVVLSTYGPLSLLSLLAIWEIALVLGWALIYLGAEASLKGASGFGSVVYFSGTSLLTLGFGDIVAHSTVLRLVTVAEGAVGLGLIALVISYLPVLYGAYGRREAQLLTLDDPTGDRIQPTALIRLHAPDGDIERLGHYFATWERWTAEVLESHVSYPMLAYFRSQHPGQSWITALGVVLDAASLTAAAVPGAESREPYFMYRRGRRAVNEIARRLHLQPVDGTALERWQMEVAYEKLTRIGLPLRDFEATLARVQAQRSTYAPFLQALIDHLLAPPGFWGHSAEDVSPGDILGY